MTNEASAPRNTALHEVHEQLGARMTDFAGWMMPLRYGSALDEHHAVRDAVGLFDLSHMAEIGVVGPDAAAMLDYSLISTMSKMPIGRAKYSMICSAEGMVLDDLVTYRRGDDAFMVVANASNRSVVVGALQERADGFDVELTDHTDSLSLIAIQGPQAETVVTQLVGSMAGNLGYYRGGEGIWDGRDIYVARTGYTGEDGFELYIRNEHAVALWRAGETAGAHHGIVPVGLAARDTLRLEAGMALYGHELDPTVTPFDANASKLIGFKKPGGFVGRDALEQRRDQPHAHLVGLQVEGRRPAREGYRVVDAESGEDIGVLTSGTLSPTLGHVIALARLSPDTTDRNLAVDVRGDLTPAHIVDLPFYKRPKRD